MKDRRPIAIVMVVAMSALVVGITWIWSAPHRAAIAVNSASSGSGNRNGSGSRTGNQGSGTRTVGMPTDTIVLPAAEDAEVEGAIICGSCRFGTAEPCNVMVWNRDAKQLYTVLPNAQLAELEKLIPDT
jgi:hypothetical protein